MSTEHAFAPGWHRDPEDPSRFRWFDGTAFTDQTREAGPGLQPATARELHADDGAWARFPERLDRSYPRWDNERIAADDAYRHTSWRRQRMLGIGLGVLAIVVGPMALLALPVVLVVAAVMWVLGRGGNAKVRAGLDRWAADLGFTLVGGTVLPGDKGEPLPIGLAPETQRALRAAGMRIQHPNGALLRGTPWRAAKGTTIQVIRGRAEYRRDAGFMTIVTVPLAAEVAARYAGVAAERPREGRSFQLRAWEEWEFAPEVAYAEFRVSARDDQRHDVGNDVLYCPVAEAWASGLAGFVIAEGALSVWCYGDLLSRIGTEQLREESCTPQETPSSGGERLARLLDQACNLQYLLYGEQVLGEQ